ncbi:MAG: MbnP family protein [Saprospiraceae bacterium]
MKKNLLFFSLFFLFQMSAIAQNSVKVKIHHKLGTNSFAFEEATTNNMGEDFQLTRLQYYISEIAIIHDQGTETYIQNTWLLADAGEATEVDLGIHDIDEIEGVSFSVGVGNHFNHSDPSLYPEDHPLAPKMPSMHWGWTSGYRFVALEGKGGSNLDQTIEIHALGDANYFRQTILYPVTPQDNEMVVHIDADYTRAIEDISIEAGLINHGSFNTAQKTLENFRDFVFSPTEEITSVQTIDEQQDFIVFPNPSTVGQSTIKLVTPTNDRYEVRVMDILGKTIRTISNLTGKEVVNLNLNQKGLFFVHLTQAGKTIATKKLLVQ